MAWLNHAAIAAPRNATTAHNGITPSTGTVVAGSAFTPTAGRLLVCVGQGAVTFTTPSGWTLPAGGSAINNAGLYVFTKTAAGSDTLSTTHNGSNYPVMFDFFEFDSTYSFVGSVSATAVAANGGAGPSITGLTGSNHVFYSAGQPNSSTTLSRSWTWSSGAEATDTSVVNATTDGYIYSTAHNDNVVAASSSSAATSTELGNTVERLTWAVKDSGGGGGTPAIPPIIVLAPRR